MCAHATHNLRLARCLLLAIFAAGGGIAGTHESLTDRARQYLIDLLRLDTSNPPGRETIVAKYLKSVADREGISAELLGEKPQRLNFVARLRGDGRRKPLLLMAHSDVVPVDRSQWSVDPFLGLIRQGFVYGRGAQDDKSLLAAELAVLTELKRRSVTLQRDVILVSEADEEAGSTGIQWLIARAWEKIAAEFALNEGGMIVEFPSGKRLYQVQTTEKVPSRVVLTARGNAGHASLPRPDNPVVHLARAITRLAEVDQPVRLNATTNRFLSELAKMDDYRWLSLLIPRLHGPQTSIPAANSIRAQDPELDALLRTTIVPTMLRAGLKINVVPNTAEAQIDVRRLPDETREEVMARLRRIIHDSSVEISPAPGQEMPATEPSLTDTDLYRKMQGVIEETSPGSIVVPYMMRGASDASFLRKAGVAVYGVPLFLREDRESRAHGNDERISLKNMDGGTRLLWSIVLAAAR
jgi:acetylornithine deacetylase/succinyl-diaminopimelate desuccinylase-like protein